HEDAAVAAQRSCDREAGARIPRRRLDDRPAWSELPFLLGRFDHRQADPVLHRAAWIQVLELCEELAGNVTAQALEPDDRSVADELENGRVLASRHGRKRIASRTFRLRYRPA